MFSLKYLALLLLVAGCAEGLSCILCDPSTCVDPVGCRGALVPDVCHCCKRCAKVLGEECGGPWNLAGICDAGLECILPVDEEGEVIDPFNASGTCKCKE